MVALQETMKNMLSGWLQTDTSTRMGLVTFLFVIYYAACNAYWINKSRSGDELRKLRRIAGLDAIDEAIGRCTEMGRPLLYNTGMEAMTPRTFASLAILGYVAAATVRYDTRIITVMRPPQVIPLVESVVSQAYMEAGNPQGFRREDVRFLTTDQFGYATGTLGIIIREQVAAHLMFGNYMAEALIFCSAGYRSDAISIAGTDNPTQTSYFLAGCDYTLLGEELFAASAYLSQDRIRISTITAQDMGKLLLVAMIALGMIFTTFGSTIIQDLMSLY
ncbi:MAG: hypothetical protein FWF06_03315 [Symbiobacteriaceae bacterium]|nr:hypothetical protein [Symbiobacteriaceae bacterium]